MTTCFRMHGDQEPARCSSGTGVPPVCRTHGRDARATTGGLMGRAGTSAAFTLIELLVVIAIIGLLAGLIVGGTKYAGTQMKVSRIRAELQALEVAIEAYHAKFNHYPPDNVVSRSPVIIVNPVTNSLYYELTGVIAQ